MAFTFLNMINAILKNNLELQGREDEYIKFRTNANTIYAVITMIISFIASIMFNINNYLPMIGCITFCFICFLLSFNMIDYSGNNYEINSSTKKKNVKHSKVIFYIILSYGFFYPTVNSGQSNGKLFIQQELLKNFNVEKTALIIGAILCISRIVRVISNITFNKIHNKYQDKVGVILPLLLSTALVFFIIGYLISFSIIIKFLVMSLGYVIILFIRDPFKVYMQDLVLKKSTPKEQQSVLTTLELSRKIGRSIISLSFTAILVTHPMIIVIIILTILSIIEIFISLYLYKIIHRNNI